ncbi:DUF6308 family protein [Williamsia sp. CHRR-6]|uniref:DUF6308 family protein n=1 Tax=Williamsia sp. CHRR-6 TaxID=2835871 RepID=UPI001BDA3029|nr:DUF6308 family protein [Williamsia sp. CHRR-6]MBT0566077.1 hypothetical protein [Williamsia sp. CHRR-6]
MNQPWVLPTILSQPREAEAAQLLRQYFAAPAGQPAFSGSRFERFAGGGDREQVANVVTADDVIAVSMLSVHVPGGSALRLLGDVEKAVSEDISRLLALLPTDLELADASDDQLAPADELWTVLRRQGKLGPTTTSKLLARKRPQLLPVMDSVVLNAVGHRRSTKTNFYRSLRDSLKADDSVLLKRLHRLRTESGVGPDISDIRIFDVVVWMDGTRHRRE